MSDSVLEITVGRRPSHIAADRADADPGAGLDAFLRDPIGFGHYDWDDPITPDHYLSARHFHGRYVEPIAR